MSTELEKIVHKLALLEQETKEPREGRVNTRRLSSADDFTLSLEIEQKITDCQIYLGSARNLPSADLSEMSSFEKLQFMREVQMIQNLQDVLDGRYSRLKSNANQYITAENERAGESDPESVGGEIACETLGIAFRKEIRGGQSYVDWEELDSQTKELNIMNTRITTTIILSPSGEEISNSTSVTKEVSEEEVSRLVKSNMISLELIRKFLKKSKVTAAMVVRKLK